MDTRKTGLAGQKNVEEIQLLQQNLGSLGYRIDPEETQAGTLAATTRAAIRSFQKAHGLEQSGICDSVTLAGIRAEARHVSSLTESEDKNYSRKFSRFHVITGYVRDAYFEPLKNVTVRAYDMNLKSEDLLGETLTADDGSYWIRYAATQLTKNNKESADLQVRVFSPDGKVLASSSTIFHAPAFQRLNVEESGSEYPGLSGYERLVRDLAPGLAGTSAGDLTGTQISFLSGSTGIPAALIRRLSAAEQQGKKTGLPAAVLYGLMSEAPGEQEAHLSMDTARQRTMIQAAADKNTIPKSTLRNADAHLETLRRFNLKRAAGIGEQAGTPQADILESLLGSDENRTRFAEKLAGHAGTVDEFWNALKEDRDLGRYAGQVKLAFQVGAVTGNHAPLVKKLVSAGPVDAGSRVTSLADLARFDENTWSGLIGTPGTAAYLGVPGGTPGKDETEKVRNYSRALTRAVETMYPALTFRYRLERDLAAAPGPSSCTATERSGQAAACRFLQDNPLFEFATTSVDTAINAWKTDLAPDQVDAARTFLKASQRLAALTPHYDDIRGLMGGGVTSAYQITRMGRTKFKKSFASQAANITSLDTIWENASHKHLTILNQAAAFHPSISGIALDAIPSPSSLAKIPTLDSLFGVSPLCECEHCRSVLSPAAYLVDLLAFLEARGSKNHKESARDVLFKRRPDIGNILLTCDNTNLPVVYVDLVNEILEDLVLGTPLSIAHRQTSGTAAELAANPQYLDNGAYDILKKESYPVLLPFDLWGEEARTYLSHLGIDRSRMMSAFREPSAGITGYHIACEYFGISDFERQILENVFSPPSVQPATCAYWGYPAANPGNWVGELSTVRTFMKRSGLSYDELVALLAMKYVNPAGSLSIVSSDTPDTGSCDPGRLKISGLDTGALHRILLFVRLWKRTGWTMPELDAALRTFGKPSAGSPPGFSRDTIVSLAAVSRLCRDYDLPVLAVMSWYGSIDTVSYTLPQEPGYRCLYEQIFQNRTVLKHKKDCSAAGSHPFDPSVCDPFALNNTRTGLNHPSLSYPDLAPGLQAALRISQKDLSLLVTGPDRVVSGPPSLDNITALFRHTTLAKALGMKIRDLLAFKKISGLLPFSDPASTGAFCESLERIRAAGFSVTDLYETLCNYALDAPGSSEATLRQSVKELRDGLLKIDADTACDLDKADDNGEVTRKKLSLILSPGDTEGVMKLVLGKKWTGPGSAENFIDSTSPDRFPFITDRTTLKAALVPEISDTLTDQERAVEIAKRTALILGSLAPYLYRVLSESFVKQKMGADLHLEDRIIADLLTRYVQDDATPPGAVLPCLAALDKTDEEKEIKKKMPVYRRLAKVAGLIGRFGTGYDELPWLFAYAEKAGWLNPATLPVETIDLWADVPALPAMLADCAKRYQQLERLAALFCLRDTIPGGTDTLNGILAAVRGLPLSVGGTVSAPSDLIHTLSTVSGWDEKGLKYLIGKIGLGLQDPALAGFIGDPDDPSYRTTFNTAFCDEKALLGILRCYDFVRRLDATPENCVEWSGYIISAGSARAIKQAAKGKYDNKEWLELAKPLRNVLREKQRAALVAYLTSPRLKADGTPVYLIPRISVSAGMKGRDVRFLQSLLREALYSDSTLKIQKELVIDGSFGDTSSGTSLALKAFQAKHQIAFEAGVAGPATWGALTTRYGPFTEATELLEYFLIDVEMSPCQMTTRIKQAISSVQMFVQRCLMNLEPDVVASADEDPDWLQWAWMKNYRVWEANRKIFLYPENWIEPELRDDKTPFFRDLENELLQQEITDENVEDIFLNYLEKLDDVARLEVCGTYHQVEKNSEGRIVIDVLHVFGRTKNVPHRYYYRRQVKSAAWTPWEKVDVDIEGDHLVPVIWNRRLHIFWPIFTAGAQGDGSVKMPAAGDTLKPPLQTLKIQMGWSELRNGKWLAKRITKDALLWSQYEAARTISTAEKPGWGIKYYTRTDRIEREPYSVPELKNHIVFRIYPGEDGTLTLWCQIYSKIRVIERTYYDVNVFGTELPEMSTENEKGDEPRNLNGVFMFSGIGGDCAIQQFVNLGSLDLFSLGAYSLKNTSPDFMELMEIDPATGCFLHGGFDAGELNLRALRKSPAPFRLLPTAQELLFVSQHPFFYSDKRRVFSVGLEEFSLNIIGILAASSLAASSAGALIPERFYGDMERATRTVQPDPREWRAGTQSFAVLPQETFALAEQSLPVVPASVNGVITAPLAFRKSGNSAPSSGGTGATTVMMYIAPEAYLPGRRFVFRTFYHPYSWLFIRELNRDGIDGLLNREIQVHPEHFLLKAGSTACIPAPLDFTGEYEPDRNLVSMDDIPYDDVDFALKGSYSQYNWEIFFHAPLLIADRLSKNQRFEEAQKWFHYIFNPTDASDDEIPRRFWVTRQFYETSADDYNDQQIENLLKRMAEQDPDSDLAAMIEEWRDNPFKPHLVARMRTVAFQKTVVMKYIDNLIAWGDQLFRRDTIESINEATQLYILAARILGPRPVRIPQRKIPAAMSYNDIVRLDPFSNFFALAENFFIAGGASPYAHYGIHPWMTLPEILYFAIPRNDKLLEYWDTVADRLFKIRHCMNIAGIERQLPIFEPPIDPALLVKAAAAGVDFGSVLSDTGASMPHYRFREVLDRAMKACDHVEKLGSSLLAALEKHDAQQLALLRSTQEIDALASTRDLLVYRADMIKVQGESLHRSLESADYKILYAQDAQAQNDWDKAADTLKSIAKTSKAVAQGVQVGVKVIRALPDIKVGTPTTMGATVGGSNFGSALESFARYVEKGAEYAIMGAGMMKDMLGRKRELNEWMLMEKTATKEKAMIDQLIRKEEIRLAVAERELNNFDRKVDRLRQYDEKMRDLFTYDDLYGWMIGQTSGVYMQGYQLAYDLAKRAEQAYRFELGLDNSGFISFGYWDGLRKGLLSGEKLRHDLLRMEAAYLDQNRRDYEIVRDISLAEIDIDAFAALRTTGKCLFDLPESLFDRDYPGHYLRRIRCMSVSISCSGEPQPDRINSTLTLTSSKSRVKTTGNYPEENPGDLNDTRFRYSFGAVQSIVTSSGKDDCGMFVLDFGDERYLPFEGSGAISSWKLDLPKETNPGLWDKATGACRVSDIVIHLRYSAREGGEMLKSKVKIS